MRFPPLDGLKLRRRSGCAGCAATPGSSLPAGAEGGGLPNGSEYIQRTCPFLRIIEKAGGNIRTERDGGCAVELS
jgi:hypothetical protein